MPKPSKWEALRQKHREAVGPIGPITLTLKTLVPEKYRVVDLETGDVWRWDAEHVWVGDIKPKSILRMTAMLIKLWVTPRKAKP